MKIFLIGFMGSGKTTIGNCLARQTGFDFADTDQIIERQQGMTVSELFARHGETAFRRMEHDILLEIQNLDNLVVSTGGGMPCYHNNMDIMLSCGKVAYLKTSPQSLTRRLLCLQNERPLIKGKTEKELQQYIVEKLSERESFYSRAQIVVQTEDFSIEELLQALNLNA